MLDRPELTASLANRARNRGRNVAGAVIRLGWELGQRYGGIGPTSRAARRFGAFGAHSVICFPYDTIVNPYAISIGSSTVVSRDVALSAGIVPDQPGLPADVVRIGDRCLIGRGSSIVGHGSIVIEDDVWTGQHVHITDMNHGYERFDMPISRQGSPVRPVRIGAGSWLGHGVVVLPGVDIGRHVVVGAGSIVTRDLPDNAVAVGAPARVVRRYDPVLGWVDVGSEAETELVNP
jgi:carbonic anhydrase/acetyltransferase-like protein (isoleucine patch superfamily)